LLAGWFILRVLRFSRKNKSSYCEQRLDIMKTFKLLTTTVLLMGFALAGQAVDHKKLQADVDAAIQEFKQADSGLAEAFKKAAGYVVFPNVGKGGFIVGGAHGNGHVYEKGKVVGYASLTQVTVGAQIGGQEYAQVIFFETPAALAKFKESEYAMSAQVSAVAASEGASQNAKYVDGVMVFTKAKTGLMAEASVGGQKFKFEPVKK
jgi:lipid-binding SYLF domain-containing protein